MNYAGWEQEARRRRRDRRRGWVAGIISLTILAAATVAVYVVVRDWLNRPVLQPEVCTATTAEGAVVLSHEQAANAALISGVGVREGFGSRGAAIALATAWQESQLQNIDWGDRDSLGLFQQRPSQGWGTPEQIMDPYYSSLTFYKALAQQPNWQTGDINDVAQAVQRSGVPDGYRKHVRKALIAADVMTGQTGSSLTCLVRTPPAPKPTELAQTISRTWGVKAQPDSATTMDLTGARPDIARAWAHQAVANMATTGVVKVSVMGQTWEASNERAAEWSPPTVAAPTTGRTPVSIVFAKTN